MSNEAIKFELRMCAALIMKSENCESFLMPMDDGNFIAVGTLSGIRTLVETEWK